MKILITGGAGFIGSHVALALLKNNHSVTILDNLSPQVHGTDPDKSPLYLSIKEKMDFVLGDIRDKNLLRSLVKEAGVVVHMAAETGTGQSMYEIERYTDVNVRGTACLLDALINTENNVRRIILSSSRAVYGEGKYNCKIHGIFYPETRKKEDLEK